MKRVFLYALATCVIASPFSHAQEKVSPKTQALLDELTKLLPEYEAAANLLEKTLDATEAKSQVAADSVRLQLLAIRSIRKVIAEHPQYLLFHIGAGHLPRWKEAAEHFLAALKSGKDGFADTTSGSRPFRSKIDDQLLLYKFTLPKDYDAKKKYPLRVHLHAGGGFTWLAYWVTGKPDANPRLASNDGAIHITPAGRQHVGMGEVAVLEAIADAQKHYSVDEDRIVIGGASWGGTGGFHFGTFLPDRFAAAHSLTGGGNYSLPVGNGRYDAYMLADNLCNLPFVIWDTPGDGHWKANHAFADELRRRAEKYPGSFPNLELTDPKGSHGIIDRKLQAEGWAWMDKQVRERFPKRVIYQTHWLRYDGAYWAHIDTMIDAQKPARIEAEMTAACVKVAFENADRFHLDLAAPLIGDAKQIEVRIDSGDALKVATPGVAYFAMADGKWQLTKDRYPSGLIKKRGVSGPIQDAFMEHPVLMVHGTVEKRTPADVTKMLDDIVNRLISTGDGSGVLRTGFERKGDMDISDRDLAAKNLILVGTPKQNRLLAKIADKLPVTFLDDGVKVAGKEYRGKDVGLTMIYPNPLNPERYVLLLPETYFGARPLDYPDYVVLQPPSDGKGNVRVLAKGNFDARWK